MVKLVKFDTSILQTLIDNPYAWMRLNEFLKRELRDFKSIESIYLFLEYIGFSKKYLNIPTHFKNPDFAYINFPSNRENAKNAREDKQSLLNDEILKLHKLILEHIENNLDKHVIKELIDNRRKNKILKHEAYRKQASGKAILHDLNNAIFQQNDLENLLFGYFIDLYENDFNQFFKHVTTMLAWDQMCSIVPRGISHDDVREFFLGAWLCHYVEHNEILALGKPAMGLSHYYKMPDIPKNARMGNNDDIVDSEIYTSLIVGYKINDELRPINMITLESPEVAITRARIISGNIVNIENTLKTNIPKFPGRIYCVDSNLNVIEIIEPAIPINI